MVCLTARKMHGRNYRRKEMYSDFLVTVSLLISIICLTEAYDCYRVTDKASKPLDLSEHSSTIQPQSPQSPHHRERRDTTSAAATSALEFDIGDYLRISQIDSKVLTNEFSVSLWVYLEGGQPHGGKVMGLRNTCYLYSPWSLFIKPASMSNNQKSKLAFSIEDVYRQEKLVSMETYKHHSWFHVAVVNDVEKLRMYVNGVRVSTEIGMKWNEFADIECVLIELGHQSNGFRGKVKDLQISADALSAKQIKQLNAGLSFTNAMMWLKEPLASLKPEWSTDSPPVVVQEFTNQKSAQMITAPTCGKTVCDDPATITSYLTNPQLKHMKTVTLEIVVMAETDGSRQAVTQDKIAKAKQYTSEAFRLTNISWQFETRLIKNSTLRRASIMLDCWPDMIGDGHCDGPCNFYETNFDGGDCKPKEICLRQHINDSICQDECNTAYFGYDYGDCCSGDQDNDKCVDPYSNNRRYFHLSEIKGSINTSDDKLSLIALNWMNKYMLGIASMPWDRNGDILFGSVIVGPSTLINAYSLDTIVHEIGHVLGLWHVHHGVSEIISCSDECLETQASLVLGDLCSDTSPTARHERCESPKATLTDVCGVSAALENTLYTNHMSYANGSCSHNKTFTQQQTARMHCYLDLVHNSAIKERKPSAVPLPPQVLNADTDSVTFSWLPPLSSGHQRRICKHCVSSHSLTQYAEKASMTGSEELGIYSVQNGPEHATGVPDSASCKDTSEVWAPALYYMKLHKYHSPQFNFTFAHAVRPQSIRLWIPSFELFYKDTPITSIQLVTPGGDVVKELLDVHIQCDKPFTKRLDMQALVNKVVINTNTPEVSFDAVELTSSPSANECSGCESLKYRIERSPSLSESVIVSETIFEDKTVEEGMEYSYVITPVNGEVDGFPSKAFQYIHNQEFCGNGKKDGDEKCDDGNLSDGDGCSTLCNVEEDYVCLGVPSVCWVDIEPEKRHCSYKFTHEQNGCGHYVPDGYTDQWASSVTTIGKHLSCKPDHLLLGPPPPGVQCRSRQIASSPPLWLPCQLQPMMSMSGKYQLKFGFEKPVVVTEVIIHIGTDGGKDDKTITLYQIYEGESKSNLIGNIGGWSIKCKDSLLSRAVDKDLSHPFKHTKVIIVEMASRMISIAAVRVRTFEKFDPIVIRSCKSGLYNTVTNQCQSLETSSAAGGSCEPIVITNGNLTCAGIESGDVCTVICDVGYISSTVSGVTTCLDGKWTTSLTCDMVTCARPRVLQGYAICEGGHRFNSVCDISCEQPSTLHGNGSAIKCLESGVWSEARSICLPMCPDLSTQNAETTDDQCVGDQRADTKCHISCQAGYFIEYSDTKTREAKTECLRSGEWSEQCVRVNCPDIPTVWKTLYSCTQDVRSGSVCTATCPNSQRASVISCSNLGIWSGSFTSCGASTLQCPAIPTSRTDITVNCTGLSFESVCRVLCKNSSHVMYRKKTDGSDVKASEFRDKLKCDAMGHWTPSIDNLTCDSVCRQNDVGDGWCDPVNNRILCQWDGGDCCTSTTKAGKVQNYPETCTSDCSCKDPKASENIMVANRRFKLYSDYAVDYKSQQ